MTQKRDFRLYQERSDAQTIDGDDVAPDRQMLWFPSAEPNEAEEDLDRLDYDNTTTLGLMKNSGDEINSEFGVSQEDNLITEDFVSRDDFGLGQDDDDLGPPPDSPSEPQSNNKVEMSASMSINMEGSVGVGSRRGRKPRGGRRGGRRGRPASSNTRSKKKSKSFEQVSPNSQLEQFLL